MPAVSSLARRLAGGRLVRNTGVALGGQVGRVLLQGAYFIVVARVLGVSGFGAFAGTVALVALLAPFGSLGAINLMIANIVVEPASAGRQYATAVAITAASGAALAAALAVVAQWVAPPGVLWWMVLCVAGGDLLGTRLLELAGAVYQARERMEQAAAFPLLLHGVRLLAAVGLSLVAADPGIGSWSVLYLVASLLVTVPVVLLTRARVGGGRPDWARYAAQWRQGLLFAVSFSAQSVYNDIDKAMLGRLATLEATGVYSAAYRIIDMAFVPMRALLSASYARFFREGAGGLAATVAFSRRLARPGLGYCLFASVALLAGADVVPVLLGDDYAEAVTALRWLSILPLLKGVHYLAADALTGAGQQGTRTAFQIGVAVLNVGLNLWLIPRYSYAGAIAASLVCDLALGVSLWGLVATRLRRRGRAAA